MICNGMPGNLDHVLFKSQQVSMKCLFQILLAARIMMIARKTIFAETTTVMTSLVTNIQQLIVVFQVLQLSIICFCVFKHQNSEVKLVGGSGPHAGNIFVGGLPVCDSYHYGNNARVVCRCYCGLTFTGKI